MKIRFFTLNGRQPAPGTIVNLRLHIDGKGLSNNSSATTNNNQQMYIDSA